MGLARVTRTCRRSFRAHAPLLPARGGTSRARARSARNEKEEGGCRVENPSSGQGAAVAHRRRRCGGAYGADESDFPATRRRAPRLAAAAASPKRPKRAASSKRLAVVYAATQPRAPAKCGHSGRFPGDYKSGQSADLSPSIGPARDTSSDSAPIDAGQAQPPPPPPPCSLLNSPGRVYFIHPLLLLLPEPWLLLLPWLL